MFSFYHELAIVRLTTCIETHDLHREGFISTKGTLNTNYNAGKFICSSDSLGRECHNDMSRSDNNF